MKKLISIVAAFAIVFIWMAGGCAPFGDVGNQESKVAALAKRIKPVPDFVAGTWVERGEDATWRMVIEPNGIVSSAVLPLVSAVGKPYQTTKVKMIDNSFSTFTGGDMFAEYTPETRELFVFIEVNKFLIRVYDVRTRGGHNIYRFTGPVSEDGKEWRPDNVNILDYGPELPIDYNIIESTPLIFDKEEVKQGQAIPNH
jgi:hypothetical protein